MQQDQFPFAKHGHPALKAGRRTTILRNGPDMDAGRDDLGALLALLHAQPLNPAYAPFMVQSEVTADHHFFGNFRSIVHPFLVETNDPDVIERLIIAIRLNEDLAAGSAPTR